MVVTEGVGEGMVKSTMTASEIINWFSNFLTDTTFWISQISMFEYLLLFIIIIVGLVLLYFKSKIKDKIRKRY